MEGFDASTYGDRFADVYDAWYGDVSDVDGTVVAVTGLAAGGPVLELGVGTGRLAIPLAAAGLTVHGIDASAAMVERLRAKPGGDAVHVVVDDFTDVPATVPGGFALILVAFNTLFNLTTAAAQRRCFQAVAARLRPGGAFVVEAFVPDPDAPVAGVTPRVVGADRVDLTVFRRDAGTQTVEGSVVSLAESGVRLRPWRLRYAAPDELDAMAAAAGLGLEARWAGWRGEPFGTASDRHVTVYRSPTG